MIPADANIPIGVQLMAGALRLLRLEETSKWRYQAREGYPKARGLTLPVGGDGGGDPR